MKMLHYLLGSLINHLCLRDLTIEGKPCSVITIKGQGIPLRSVIRFMVIPLSHKVEEEVDMASYPAGRLPTPGQSIVLSTLRHFQLNHSSWICWAWTPSKASNYINFCPIWLVLPNLNLVSRKLMWLTWQVYLLYYPIHKIPMSFAVLVGWEMTLGFLILVQVTIWAMILIFYMI